LAPEVFMTTKRPSVECTVVDKIDPGPPGKRRYRWAYRDGKRVRLRVIDANSPTFTADLTDAFRENVRRAIRENRELAKQR
jgi:hypothetical protein